MPVKKETSSRLVKFGYHFESIPREVVQRISNPVALAYYTYLNTLPNDWVIRSTHLREHFGIGQDRHLAAMEFLREMGLVWYQYERDGGGKITDRKLMCGAVPVDELPTETRKTHIKDKPVGRENPLDGKSVSLQIDTVTTDRHSCLETYTVDEGFDIFWQWYPRKEAKAAAKKAWAKLDPDQHLLDRIVDHIQRRVAGVQWVDKKFIPLPATFLNGERWEDEIISAKPDFTAIANNTKEIAL